MTHTRIAVAACIVAALLLAVFAYAIWPNSAPTGFNNAQKLSDEMTNQLDAEQYGNPRGLPVEYVACNDEGAHHFTCTAVLHTLVVVIDHVTVSDDGTTYEVTSFESN